MYRTTRVKNIDQALRANVDRYIGSDAFAAMQADVEMYGEDAFIKNPEIQKDKP
jgi:hypothetical protein